ncbi:hypothetical protein SEHO0A_04295 [Salmonella enterica subsp. houtenae str. ATCC BAA-1581]|nr:hypothetical protein SEHO0A_04295 [Salmonella enterica subsp. houtenae str. ATCC BAA-1581]ENZ84435.1 hypothetical protein D088_720023 [Salmonella enterica subsp. houtenae serovar 16:z4,z32:-- str. RKS3027]
MDDGGFNGQGRQLSFFTLPLRYIFSVILILFNVSKTNWVVYFP